MAVERQVQLSIHRLLPAFAVTSVMLTFATLQMGDASPLGQIIVTCLVIFLIGMPHGGLDVIMINRLAQSRLLPSIFNGSVVAHGTILLGYLSLVVMAWSLWILLPAFSLAVFLFIAAVHFSKDWGVQSQTSLSFSLAVLTIALPALFHPASLREYFQALLLTVQQADTAVTAMQLSIAPALLIFIYHLIMKRSETIIWVWLGAMMVAAYWLTPLWYFCVYFCAVHSVLHTLHIKVINKLTWKDIGKALIFPMIGTTTLLIIAYVALPTNGLNENLLQITYIGLFALTVPHMLLTYIHDAILPHKFSSSAK